MAVLGVERMLQVHIAVSFVWFRSSMLLGRSLRDTFTPQTPSKELCHYYVAFVYVYFLCAYVGLCLSVYAVV